VVAETKHDFGMVPDQADGTAKVVPSGAAKAKMLNVKTFGHGGSVPEGLHRSPPRLVFRNDRD